MWFYGIQLLLYLNDVYIFHVGRQTPGEAALCTNLGDSFTCILLV